MGIQKPVLKDEDFILVVLQFFHQKGEKEVSLSEFMECIEDIQKYVSLGYEFSKSFLYSLDLLKDLRKLEYKGFVHRFMYRHDSFLPKRYLKLTEFGGSHINRILQEKVLDEISPIIEKSVDKAIQSNRERWELFERPTGLY